jgi:hypothetical protein
MRKSTYAKNSTVLGTVSRFCLEENPVPIEFCFDNLPHGMGRCLKFSTDYLSAHVISSFD